MQKRDLQGYTGKWPDPQWPGRARVAVSFVVNFEEGSEATLSHGDDYNEAVYEVTDQVIGVPDRCMESHYEYGTKAGFWRIMNCLDRHAAKCTVSACGYAAELSSDLIRYAVAGGHEISAHGWRWQKHTHMAEEEERKAIAQTVTTLTAIAGERPVGWHTRSTPSINTRRLLVEEGGFVYDSDDYSDDLPFFTEVSGRRHLVLPYAFDTNDMNFWHGFHRFVTANDFAEYCTDAFDALWVEGEQAPKMMSIGLHLRMIGRPGRIAGLEKVIHHMRNRGQVWFARRRDIAEHWMRRFAEPK
ncbi:MAG: polysaccharide deacetylase family protein [Hyphomicrobiaceae bacterium]